MHKYLLVVSVLVGSASVPFVHAAPLDPAADQQSHRLVCSSSISKILPGDYNFCLGQRYWESGQYESARQMLELAAGWGNKAAQRALGVAYFNGDGLTKDRPLGLAWLALSGERKEPATAALYNSAFDQSSVEERKAGALILAQLKQRYSDDVAAQRADNRFQRTLHAMSSNPVYGRGQCLAGSGGLPAAAAMNQAAEGAGGCSMAADNRFLAALEERYDAYSEGWSKRRVQLGAPQSLPRD